MSNDFRDGFDRSLPNYRVDNRCHQSQFGQGTHADHGGVSRERLDRPIPRQGRVARATTMARSGRIGAAANAVSCDYLVVVRGGGVASMASFIASYTAGFPVIVLELAQPLVDAPYGDCRQQSSGTVHIESLDQQCALSRPLQPNGSFALVYSGACRTTIA